MVNVPAGIQLMGIAVFPLKGKFHPLPAVGPEEALWYEVLPKHKTIQAMNTGINKIFIQIYN
jgi:hypothetical protein